MNNEKTRDLLMDNLKGLLILCVVLGHFCERYRETHSNLSYLMFFIYVFHMPCFIFISGYFSKHYNFKKTSKLIYQYIIFGIIYTLIVNTFPDINIEFQISYTVWGFWYLIALFYWKNIVHFIKKKNLIILIVSIVLSIIIGCFKNVGNYFTLARAFSFFPFFLLGYYSNKTTITKIKNISKPIIIVFAIIIILSVYIIVITNFIPLEFQWYARSFNKLSIENIDGVIYKTILLILAFLAIIVLINLMPYKKTILTKYGESSITIYVFHTAIIYSFTRLVIDIPPYKGLIYPYIILITIALSYLLQTKPIKKLYNLLMKPYEKISEDGDVN